MGEFSNKISKILEEQDKKYNYTPGTRKITIKLPSEKEAERKAAEEKRKAEREKRKAEQEKRKRERAIKQNRLKVNRGVQEAKLTRQYVNEYEREATKAVKRTLPKENQNYNTVFSPSQQKERASGGTDVIDVLKSASKKVQNSAYGKALDKVIDKVPLFGGVRFAEGMMVKKEPEERDTFAEKLGASWTRGTQNVISDTIGGPLKYIGEKTGIDAVRNVGKSISKTAEKAEKGFEAKESTSPFKFKDLGDPDFYANKVGEALPNIAASVVPGIGAMKALDTVTRKLPKTARIISNSIGGSLVSGTIDSVGEAGGAYNIAEDRKMSDRTGVFEEVLGKNMALNTGLDAAQFAIAQTPLGRISRYGNRLAQIATKSTANAGVEAFQEGYQNKITSEALGDKFSWTSPDTVEAMVIGALLGGGVTAASSSISREDVVDQVDRKVQDRMTPTQRKRFDTIKTYTQRQGADEDTATERAYTDFTNSEEGKQIVAQATKEYIDNKKRELEVTKANDEEPSIKHAKSIVEGEEVTVGTNDVKVRSVRGNEIEVEDNQGNTTFVPSEVVNKKNEAPDLTKRSVVKDNITEGTQVEVEGEPGIFTVAKANDPTIIDVQNENGDTLKVDRNRAIPVPTIEETLIAPAERNIRTMAGTFTGSVQPTLTEQVEQTQPVERNMRTTAGTFTGNVQPTLPGRVEETQPTQIEQTTSAIPNTFPNKIEYETGAGTNVVLPGVNLNNISLRTINDKTGAHFTNWDYSKKVNAINLLNDAIANNPEPDKQMNLQHDIDAIRASMTTQPDNSNWTLVDGVNALRALGHAITSPEQRDMLLQQYGLMPGDNQSAPFVEDTTAPYGVETGMEPETEVNKNTTYNAELIEPTGINPDTGRPMFKFSEPSTKQIVIQLKKPKTVDGESNKKSAYLHISVGLAGQKKGAVLGGTIYDKGKILIGAYKGKRWGDHNIHDVFLDIPEYVYMSKDDLINYLNGMEVSFATREEQLAAEEGRNQKAQETEQRMLENRNPQAVFQSNKDAWESEPFQATHVRFTEKSRTGREYHQPVQIVGFETGKGPYYTRREEGKPYISPAPASMISKNFVPIQEAEQAIQEAEQVIQEPEQPIQEPEQPIQEPGQSDNEPEFGQAFEKGKEDRKKRTDLQETPIQETAVEETPIQETAVEEETQTQLFEEGQYVRNKKNSLTGRVRKDMYEGNTEVSVNVEQITTAGGVPIGRIEYWDAKDVFETDKKREDAIRRLSAVLKDYEDDNDTDNEHYKKVLEKVNGLKNGADFETKSVVAKKDVIKTEKDGKSTQERTNEKTKAKQKVADFFGVSTGTSYESVKNEWKNKLKEIGYTADEAINDLEEGGYTYKPFEKQVLYDMAGRELPKEPTAEPAVKPYDVAVQEVIERLSKDEEFTNDIKEDIADNVSSDKGFDKMTRGKMRSTIRKYANDTGDLIENVRDLIDENTLNAMYKEIRKRIEAEVSANGQTNEVRENVQTESPGEQSAVVQGTEQEQPTNRNSVPETGVGEVENSPTSNERNVDTGGTEPGDTGGLTDTNAGRNRSVELEEVISTEEAAMEKNPSEEKGLNYRITDKDDLTIKGKKETAKRNIEIIKLALKIQEENRLATLEEKQQLVKYTGWGGLKDALDERWMLKDEWKPIQQELKEILTPEQFKMAQQSRLNAHYTEKDVIESIYKGIEHLGFKGGRVLEPSMGIGHFIGMAPDSLYNKTRYTGIELDEITGLIGRLLYPQADIRVQGLQQAQIPDNYYDVVIGNVPFGNYAVNDAKFNKLKLNSPIHDYFFAKTLDKVREGGLMVLITSRYTLDKDGKLRTYMKDKVDFVGAIRLPSGTFKGSADTEVVTDIVVLKKLRNGEKPSNEWGSTKQYFNNDTLEINSYFVDNPKMMLGTPELSGSMYRGNEFNLVSKKSVKLKTDIVKAFEKMPKEIYDARQTRTFSKRELVETTINAPSELKNGAFVVKDGIVFQNDNGKLVDTGHQNKPLARLKDMIGLRDTLVRLFQAQIDDKSNNVIDGIRKELNVKYDSFVKKHGFLNQDVNVKLIAEDPDAYLLLAIENWNPETKKATKADIFTKNTISKYVPVEKANTPEDALSISLMEYGSVNLKRIGELLSMNEEQVIKELGDSIFKNPISESYETRQEYLSGNIRTKLIEAETAFKTDKSYKRNVDELKKIIPEDIPTSEIEVEIGAGWLPQGLTEKFIVEHLLNYSGWRKDKMKFDYEPHTGNWILTKESMKQLNDDYSFTNAWGSQYIQNGKLIESILNRKQLRVTNSVTDEFGNKKSVVNVKATMEVRGRAKNIKDEFKRWVKENEDIAPLIERTYNDKFNSVVLREYDGSHLPDILPNMNPNAIKGLREHQKNAIFRATQQQSTLLAHAVGAGKTFEMIASMMEMKRMGIIKKPVWVVPNHLVGQMASDFLKLYPQASVLVPSKKDFEKDRRKKLFAKIATNNFDVVILASSNFKKIAVSDDTLKRFYQEQIDQLELALQAEVESGSRGKSRARSSLMKMIENLKVKMEKKLDKEGEKDKDTATFEQMGFDAVVVDEAHMYKNLMYGTKQGNVGGLGNMEGSDRALDMYMKTKLVQENNGRVIFATGTPISNSIAEMYHMMRFLSEKTLKEMGMNNFDAWADVFTQIGEVVQLSHEGKGFKTTLKVKEISNAPELLTIWKSFADVQTTDELLSKKLISHPKHERHIVEVEPTTELIEYVDYLAKRGEAIRGKTPLIENDNPLYITTDGRKAALDMRLTDKFLPDNPNFKIHDVADKVSEIYKATKKDKGTQLIFIDGTSPVDKDKVEEDGTLPFNYYGELRRLLERNGVPESEVAFIQEYKTDAAKTTLFSKVNSGDIRVLIGSSDAMGAGMNVQRRLKALHHVTPTFKPSDLEQREGRILRQGNIYDENGQGVDIYTYVSVNSFDAYLWQLIEYKAKLINKIMSGKISGRKIEDEGDIVLTAAQLKALASGDERIIEYEQIKNDVDQLQIDANAHKERAKKAKRMMDEMPGVIKRLENQQSIVVKDSKRVVSTQGDKFSMKLGGITFTERKEAGTKLRGEMNNIFNQVKAGGNPSVQKDIGSISGFTINYKAEKDLLDPTKISELFALTTENGGHYPLSISPTELGTITGIERAVASVNKLSEVYKEEISKKKDELKRYEDVAKSTFKDEKTLKEKEARMLQLEKDLAIEKDTEEYVLEDGEDNENNVSSLLNTAKAGGTDNLIGPKTAKQVGDILANALDTVLREGYVEGRGARGTFNYKKQTGNVKRKDIHNFRVIAHELGHAFELYVGPDLLRKYRSELIHVAEQLYPNAKSLKGTQKVKEGLAELFQLYLRDPEAASSIAPETTGAIEAFIQNDDTLNKAFKEASTLIQADVQGGAFKRIKNSISFVGDEDISKGIGTEYSIKNSVGEGLFSGVRGFVKQQLYEFVNSNIPLEDMQKALDGTKYAGKNLMMQMATSGNSNELARKTFEGWAMNKAGRYIINYKKPEDLPDFLREKYENMMNMEPSNISEKVGYLKRYKEFYNQFMKDGSDYPKQKAALLALSSRSLQEIAVDAIEYIETNVRKNDVPENIANMLEQLDTNEKGKKEKTTSYEFFSMIAQSYRYLERSMRTDEEGNQKFKQNPINQEDAQAMVDYVRRELPAMENLVKEYTSNLSEILLTKSVDAGVITEKDKKNVQKGSSFYIPTYEASRGGATSGEGGGRKAAKQTVRSYREGDIIALDVIQATLNKLVETETSVEFKGIMDSIEKALKEEGMGKFGEIIKPSRIPKKVQAAQFEKQILDVFESETTVDPNDIEGTLTDKVFSYFMQKDMLGTNEPVLMNWHYDKNGKKELVYMRIAPDIFNAMMAMKPLQFGIYVRTMAKFSSLTRYLALANLKYLKTTFERDTVTAYLQREQKRFSKFASNTLKSTALAAGLKPEVTDQYVNSGAFISNPESVLSSFTRKSLTEGLLPTKSPTLWKMKNGKLIKMFNFSSYLNWSESIHRYSEFVGIVEELAANEGLATEDVLNGTRELTKEELKKVENILLEAGYRASEVTTNFRKHGASETFRTITAPVSFLHGTIQGLYRELQEVKRNGWNKASKRLTIRMTPIVLFTVAAWAISNALGDDFEEIPTDLRDRNWFIPTPWGYYSIAKPFTYSMPLAYAERFLDDFLGEEGARKWYEDYFNPIKNAFSVPMLPLWLQTIEDLRHNETWWGGEIVNSWEKDEPDYLQYDANTSKIAKWQAEVTFRLRNYLNGVDVDEEPYNANYKYGIPPKMFDYAVKGLFSSLGTTILELTSDTEKKDLFGAKRIMTDPYKTRARNVDKFYKKAENVEKGHKVAGVYGEPSDAVRFYRDAKKAMTTMNKIQSRVTLAKEINAEEKKTMLQNLAKGKRDLARVGLKMSAKDQENLKSVLNLVDEYDAYLNDLKKEE